MDEAKIIASLRNLHDLSKAINSSLEIDEVEEMKEVLPGVRHHHEWFDGSGYPDSLQKDAIPLQARIISIADAFDALTTDRPYRNGLNTNEALELLRQDSGSHFDPSLLTSFCNVIKRSSDSST